MDVVENLEAAIAAVEEARSVPLSASCVINRSELLQLLDKIKVSFPNDLAKAIAIQRDKENILEDAHEQADAIIEQAREEVARLVEQTTIVSSAAKKLIEFWLRQTQMERRAEKRLMLILIQGLQHLK